MNKLLFVVCLFFVFPILAVAQDTIYLDKKVQYFSKDGAELNKLTRFYTRTSSELVELTNNRFKIEHVLYFDNKRLNYGGTENFKIQKNSILITDRERWNFKKISKNKFLINP